MRTEGTGPGSDPTSGALSRRSFVLAGGAAAGTVVGSGMANATSRERSPTVAATAPYVSGVRRAASDAGSSVAVRPATGADGAPDVLVSGVPGSAGDGYSHREAVVDGVAALSHPDGTWRDVLRPTDVRDRWSGERPVETWLEGGELGLSDADGSDCPGAIATDGVERAPLVRGRRAAQYSNGRGGVGYYDVEPAAIGEIRSADADSTSIARLGFVHATAEALEDDGVSSVLASYGLGVGDGGEVTGDLLAVATPQ